MTLRNFFQYRHLYQSGRVQIMLGGIVLSIIINTLVLVITALYIPQGGLTISPLSWSVAPLLLILGAVFWLMYWVIRKILQFLATPINIITLGIASIIINMLILYVFEYVVGQLNIGITVSLGSIEQTFILSIIITLLTLILKKIF